MSAQSSVRKALALAICALAILALSVLTPATSMAETSDGDLRIIGGRNARWNGPLGLSFRNDKRIPLWASIELDRASIRPDTVPHTTMVLSDTVVPSMSVLEQATLENRDEVPMLRLVPRWAVGGDTDQDGETIDEGDEDEASRALWVGTGDFVVPLGRGGSEGLRGEWDSLCNWIREDLLARTDGRVWWVSGTIAGPAPLARVGFARDIEVPAAVFVVVSCEKLARGPSSVGFLLPLGTSKPLSLDARAVSIDVIEALAGIDVVTSSDRKRERQMEALPGDAAWRSIN